MTDENNVGKENSGEKKEKKNSIDEGIYKYLWRLITGDFREIPGSPRLPGPPPPMPKHITQLLREQVFSNSSASVLIQPGSLTDIKAHPVEDSFLKLLTDVNEHETDKIKLICSQPETAYRVFKAIDLEVDIEAIDLPDFKK